MSESAAGVSRSAGPAPRPRVGRWGFWAVAFVGLSLFAGYALSALRRPQLQAAVPAEPVRLGAPGVASEQTQQALRGTPAPGAGGGTALGSSEPGSTSPHAEAAPKALPASATQAESRPEAAPARKRVQPSRANAPPPPTAEPASEAAQRPFQWHFPDDPYEAKAPASPSKPAADAR